jgi:ubiquinol-cytochrome c reductase subunit 6
MTLPQTETDEEEPAKQEDAETVTKEEEATSPQEEEEVESPPEAEEEVPEDPVARYRAECAKEERMRTLKKILEECNERVRTTPDSGESCHMEMVDWVHALDHCAMPKAFRELK